MSWISQRTIRFPCAIVMPISILTAGLAEAAPRMFSDAECAAIESFLHEQFAESSAGMVIGLIDERGQKIFAAGALDNGTDQRVDADTVFEIGSITKTFTSLLLLDMVERGDMKLDDPVAKYLPKSVRMPAHGGKQITLQNLAAQDSGLPFNADNLSGDDWVERFNAYRADDMYAFLSGHKLAVDPGLKFQYSNIGMSLLGHAMELKANKTFESLAVARICCPLHMESTGIALAPELTARMATGHDEHGKPAKNYDFQVMAGAGALRSTAHDLLKYVSANLGLSESSLRPLMEKMQIIRHTDSPEMGKTAMPWYDQGALNPPGMELLGHGGGTGGCSTFIGFDKRQRRGVVVLSNQKTMHASPIGWTILQGLPLTRASGGEFMRELVGIGTALDLDKSTNLPRITRVIENSPAARAGLQSGQLIRKIDDESTSGKNLGQCLEMIRGPVGTKLRLEIVTPPEDKSTTMELTRARFAA